MAYGVDAFDEKYMRTVIRPFEAAHPGILVRYYAVRDSRNALAVLRSQRMTPNIDVVILDPPNARLAQSEGLLEQMNPQLVPNAADLGAMGRELGFWRCRPCTTPWRWCTPNRPAQPPRSWRELWDPKHRGKIAISTNANVNGSMIALTALANRLAGSPDGAADLDPGLEYLEKLGPNVQTWTPRPNQYWLVARKRCCWPWVGIPAARVRWTA